MTKIVAGILAFAFLAVPAYGFADQTGAIGPINAKIGPKNKEYVSFCGPHATNSYKDTVLAIGGGNWGGDNYVTFYVSNGGYDSLSWPETYPQAQSMVNILMLSYTDNIPITVYCVNGLANGAWIGEGP